MILSERRWGGTLLAFPCQVLMFKYCSLKQNEGFHCSTVGGIEKWKERWCACGGIEAPFWSWCFLRAPVTSSHPSDLFIDFLRVYTQSPYLPASVQLFCGVLQGHHTDFSFILIFPLQSLFCTSCDQWIDLWTNFMSFKLRSSYVQ